MRDFNTGLFLWILQRNFKSTFYWTSPLAASDGIRISSKTIKWNVFNLKMNLYIVFNCYSFWIFLKYEKVIRSKKFTKMPYMLFLFLFMPYMLFQLIILVCHKVSITIRYAKKLRRTLRVQIRQLATHHLRLTLLFESVSMACNI